MCVAIDQGGPEFGDARNRGRDGLRRGLRQAGPGQGGVRLPAPRREQNPVVESATDRLDHVTGARRRPVSPDPFAALGQPARNDLTNEQVRAAWRHIAAATHPDRPDGGDIARYTAAASAYAQLRTQWGRSEAYADQLEAGYGPVGARTVPLPAIRDDHNEMPARPVTGAARLARTCWLLPARCGRLRSTQPGATPPASPWSPDRS